ncbi:hypothetical protein C2845_PM15G20700 [Panicum miliaceum]|uniref:Uncharacterized protein n=1 Tax=Panicum miliaceum TaxID=4540 RepID=A0A3L6Q4L2_PANMI|nr:hypothetical protein C2845_PM15G20700 [Panicum miliaceum]
MAAAAARLLLPRAARTAASSCSATAIARGPLNSFSRRFRTFAPPYLRPAPPPAKFLRGLSDAAFDAQALDTRVPATVITGFLGSGKVPPRPPTRPSLLVQCLRIGVDTTLLNHILTSQHGKRIAVIENEFGEVDIDSSLVASHSSVAEDIVMVNNGCLCCTVRGDLVKMLLKLVKQKGDKFDHIVIETTGLAKPGPVIETFCSDELVSKYVKLDGVVTMVDCKHAMKHLNEAKARWVVNEAVEQVAYADRVILNKIDLVDDAELEALTNKIKIINGMAQMKKAKFGDVDMDFVLGIGGYDLDRIEAEVQLQESKETGHCHHGDEHGHHHDHVHDSAVTSVSIVSEGVLDLDEVNDWLERLVDEKGSNSISSPKSGRRRTPAPRRLLQEAGCRPYMPPLSTGSRNPSAKCYGDRFIPERSAMDMDLAHYLLTEPRKGKENLAVAASPAKEAYRKLLAEKLLNNRTRILAFRNKPPEPESMLTDLRSDAVQAKPAKQRRHIPQSSDRTLDAPELADDYYLNLLDWGSSNVLSIALGSTVYLWDASNGSTSELVTVGDDYGPVTSVSWAPDGRHIAVGLDSSDVQLWDTTSNRLLRTLRGVHELRVGSLAWNNSILTTGGMDGKIVNNDVRIRNNVVQTYHGHEQEVCGLKWSGSGQQLASGGNDNLLHIWDVSMSSSVQSAGRTQWLHRLQDHLAAVKALAWCPFQSNLLASGGGGGDRCIKFWNTHTGACLNSIDTGSQVCALLWNKNERELLSSHGFTQNQLTLWKYPSMVKMAELNGHTSRVLFMAQSPDGCTVASAAADETLRFWNVFGTPEAAPKAAAKASHTGIFNSFNHIR